MLASLHPAWAVVGLVGLVFSIPTPGQSQTPAKADEPSVFLVVDGSGSMWGSMGPRLGSKLQAAQNALAQSLAKVPKSTPLGLYSYGHRRRGACSDAAVVTPVAPGNLEAILKQTKKLNPKGMGPMGLALTKVARDLPKTGPVSVVIMHDGPDNCGQDPCAVAKELVKTNPRVSIDVISLALDPNDLKKVQCLAKTGRGQLYDARDPQATVAALDDILARLTRKGRLPGSVATPGGADPDADQKQKPKLSGLNLIASLSKEGQQVAGAAEWRISPVDQSSGNVREFKGARVASPLPAGAYDVEVRAGLATAKQKLDIKDDTDMEVRFDLNAGVLTFGAANTTSNGRADFVALYPASKDGAEGGDEISSDMLGDPLWLMLAPTDDLVVPAGSYWIKTDRGMTSNIHTIKLAAGERRAVGGEQSIGRLELSSQATGSAMPLKDVLYVVLVDDPFSATGRREVARSSADRPSFELTAGTYHVVARRGTVEKRDLVAVGTSNVVRHVVDLPIAQLAVEIDTSETLAQDLEGMLTRVLKPGTGYRAEVARSSASQPRFDLAPGRYEVAIRSQTGALSASTVVDVAVGETTTAKFRLQAGNVKVEHATHSGWGSQKSWRILDKSGQTIVHSRTGQNMTARLAPGSYVMQADRDGDVYTEPFTVEAGQTLNLRIP